MKTSKRWKVITIICMVTVMMLSPPACGNVSETNSNNKENLLEKDSEIVETEVRENSNPSQEPLPDDNRQDDGEEELEKSDNAEPEENNDTELEENDNTESEKNDNKEPEKNNNPNQENTENEYTDLSRFYGYNLPLRFNAYHTDREDGTLAFSVTDKGDYCILEGSLTCPECVETSVIQEIEVGDQFTTGSGHTYTITGRESYNNYQREKVSFLSDDGKNYEITNIPAFFVDAYKQTAYYIISSPENNTVYESVFENVKLRMDKDKFPFIANLEEEYDPLFFDIGFAEDGTIDVLQAVDYGSNGPWDSIENIEIWQGELE